MKHKYEQESSPVGYIPPTFVVPDWGGGGSCLLKHQTPNGIRSPLETRELSPVDILTET